MINHNIRYVLALLASAVLSLACHAPLWAGIQCDGTDDVLTFGSTTLTTTFTLEAWVQPTATGLGGFVMNSTGGRGWFRDTDDLHYFAGGAASLGSTTTVPNNTWTHIAVVASGGSATLYTAGVADGTGTAESADVVGVCNYTADGSLPFAGRIDHMAVYAGVALNAGEITTLAKSLKHQPFLSRRASALWLLDQCGDGASVNAVGFVDRSGNGKTLTADNGSNNTGMTCSASRRLTYSSGAE